MCFAAMRGDVMIIQALLDHRADPNDRTTKTRVKAQYRVQSSFWLQHGWTAPLVCFVLCCTWQEQIPKRQTALGIASYFRNNDAVKLLLSAAASVNARCDSSGTPLHFACCSDTRLSFTTTSLGLLYN